MPVGSPYPQRRLPPPSARPVCLLFGLSALTVRKKWTATAAHWPRPLADTTADALLNTQQINLTVIANRLTALEEIAGIAFFDAGNDMMAMSGLQPSNTSYTAQATIDDTLSGIVYVTLNREAFAPPLPWALGLLSIIALLLTPPVTVMVIRFSAQGNRSLPIVSVPAEPVSYTHLTLPTRS